MSTKIEIKNPLKRSGLNQRERLLDALIPNYFKLDDRSMKDLLAFTRQYAEKVNYFNEENARDGNWTCFWEIEPLVLLATLASKDTDEIALNYKNAERAYRNAKKRFEEDENCKEDESNVYLDRLIRIVYDIAKDINDIYTKLPDLEPIREFKGQVKDLVEVNFKGDREELQKALFQLIAYDKHAHGADLLDYKPFIESTLWKITRDEYFCILPSVDLTLHDLRKLFLQFLKALKKLTGLANSHFDRLIANHKAVHQPHIALFITFLRLFQHAQNFLNELTGKHLDYYYEEVLCLQRRPEQADEVHLIFELAKDFHQHHIVKGTILDAGSGLKYETAEEWTVTSAQVDCLKTIYLKYNELEDPRSVSVNALPGAEKEDGEKLPFRNPANAYWRAFGDYDERKPQEKIRAQRKGEIGLAIASNQLILREGIRIINLKFEGIYFEAFNNPKVFLIALSCKTGWYSDIPLNEKLGNEITNQAIVNSVEYYKGFNLIRSDNGNTEILNLKIVLPPDAPAIEAFDVKNRHIIDAEWPVLKIFTDSLSDYHNFFNKITIDVDVYGIQEGLILQNDDGVFSSKRQFFPFTALPEKGKYLYLGNTEAFQKKLTNISIDFQWMNPPDNFSTHYQNYTDTGVIAPQIAPEILINGSFSVPLPYNIIFLVGDTNKPTQGEQSIVNLLEKKMGLAVRFYPENTKTDILKKASLVIISSTVNAENVDTDFNLENSVPIITWEKNIYDNLNILNKTDNSKNNRGLLNKNTPVKLKITDPNHRLFHGISIDGENQIVDLGFQGNIPWGIASYNVIATYFNDGDKAVIICDEKNKILTLFLWHDTAEIFNREEGKNARIIFENSIKWALNINTKIPLDKAPTKINFINNESKLASSFSIPLAIRRRDIRAQDFTEYSPRLSTGFLRLQLTDGDFMHREYPKIVSDKITASPPEQVPNPPYTPSTNLVRFGYSARLEIDPSDNEGLDQLFYVTPFGGSRKIAELRNIDFFDPNIVNRSFRQNCGFLYIGIKNLHPGQNLAMLVQVREGSEREFDTDPPNVEWSYIGWENEWLPFPAGGILQDDTLGLTRSGIIQLAIPDNIVRENTLLDASLHWLRASVRNEGDKKIGAFPDIIAIRTQAIKARYVLQEDASAHLAEVLPPGTIKKLAVADYHIKRVEQPYPSFNGKLSEQGDEFYRRVSERLRHRERAVTIYDYEHLLLEKYPEIQQVRCLNHTRWISGGALNELAPGYVTVVVVPALRNRNIFNRSEPRVPIGKRRAMESWLRPKTNLFVGKNDELRLRVVNPAYEQLKVECKVVLKPKLDREYYKQRLDEDIKRFLAPWIFDDSAEIILGRTIRKSAILYFVETLDYIEAVADFKVYKDERMISGDLISPVHAHGVLTSYINPNESTRATDHTIYLTDLQNLCI
jgi:hypothetical protein